MRFLRFLVILCAIEFGASSAEQARRIDDAKAWRETADRFMQYLVDQKIDAALDMMESGFIEIAGGRDKAKSTINSLFDYCGRPLDRQFQQEMRGLKQYPDGRRKECRKFFYDATTNQHPKGVCSFSIGVVPDERGDDLVVTEFGPLKRIK